MSVSDPVADYLTAVRNAIHARQRRVDVPASKLKLELAKVLLRERFINNYKVIEGPHQGTLRIYLKYTSGDDSVITGIKRVSTPGRRVYVNRREIPRVFAGMGMSVLSTSRGLMTDREAREAGLGGEIVCQVW